MTVQQRRNLKLLSHRHAFISVSRDDKVKLCVGARDHRITMPMIDSLCKAGWIEIKAYRKDLKPERYEITTEGRQAARGWESFA